METLRGKDPITFSEINSAFIGNRDKYISQPENLFADLSSILKNASNGSYIIDISSSTRAGDHQMWAWTSARYSPDIVGFFTYRPERNGPLNLDETDIVQTTDFGVKPIQTLPDFCKYLAEEVLSSVDNTVLLVPVTRSNGTDVNIKEP